MFKIFFFSLLICCVFAPKAFATIDKLSRVDSELFRGAQPQTVSDYQLLKSMGVRTIVNLRETPQDIQVEAMLSRQMGFNFKSFPIDGMSNPNPQEVSEILLTLNARALLPVFVHCHAGKDRTGLIIGLYRVETNHWLPQRAYQEMLSFGFDPNLKGLYDFFWSSVRTFKHL